MSETSEQQVTTRETGPCEKAATQVTHSSWNQHFNEEVLQMTIASTIDSLAADVAAIKEAVCGNHSKTSNSSPAAPQPAAPQAGWLTDRERRAVAYFAQVCRDDLVPDEWTDSAGVLRSILSRAGSPPVVEVPKMVAGRAVQLIVCGHPDEERLAEINKENALCFLHTCYRAALDKAGVQWKEVGRE